MLGRRTPFGPRGFDDLPGGTAPFRCWGGARCGRLCGCGATTRRRGPSPSAPAGCGAAARTRRGRNSLIFCVAPGTAAHAAKETLFFLCGPRGDRRARRHGLDATKATNSTGCRGARSPSGRPPSATSGPLRGAAGPCGWSRRSCPFRATVHTRRDSWYYVADRTLASCRPCCSSRCAHSRAAVARGARGRRRARRTRSGCGIRTDAGRLCVDHTAWHLIGGCGLVAAASRHCDPTLVPDCGARGVRGAAVRVRRCARVRRARPVRLRRPVDSAPTVPVFH